MNDDAEAIVATRAAVVAELGPDAASEAAAVMAMFSVMARIADSTGTPVDGGPAEVFVRDVGETLGMTTDL